MSSSYSVTLPGPAPWGFRLQGGKDFNLPLAISRLTDGGKAARGGISVGDLVVSIDGITTEGMNHLEAQNKIKSCSGNLSLTLHKASSAPKPPPVAPKTAAPPPVANGPQSILKKPQAPRVPRKHIVDTDIHFYHVPTHADASRKRITEDTEDWRPRTGTTQSKSFRILAQITGTENVQAEESDSAKKKNCVIDSQTLCGPVSESSLAQQQEEESLHEPNHAGGAVSSSSPSSSSSPAPHCFPLAPTESAPVLLTTDPSRTSARLSVCHKKPVRRELLLKPLDFLPRAAPRPPCLTSSAPQAVAPRTHNEGCSPELARARPGSWLSPSLLDALLISPLPEVPLLGLRRRTKRRSASDLRLPRNKRVSWHQSSTSAGDPLFSSPVNAIFVFSEEAEEQTINSHESAVVKTMIRSPPAAQGRSPQTGLLTPSFSMKGSGNTSVQQGLVQARPIPQPHPSDQDTLVQMAEHIPAGTRTPMCAHCNMVIRGPFLVAMGRSWHKEEFNCAHCRSSLAHTGFVEEKGSVYCEHCYEEFLAPTCSRCHAKILGEVINALKQSWHVYCFLCACCQQPIRNNTFHLEDGEPYCEQDFYSLFGTGCHGCEFPIEAGDKFLEALGHIWHDNCFVCAVCCTSLEGQTFFSKKDKPLCKKHAHTFKI